MLRREASPRQLFPHSSVSGGLDTPQSMSSRSRCGNERTRFQFLHGEEHVQLFLNLLSPLNPLEFKGVGEPGILPVPAVIVPAIEDALSNKGTRVRHMLLSLWQST
jgi:hypothetical protein